MQNRNTETERKTSGTARHRAAAASKGRSGSANRRGRGRSRYSRAFPAAALRRMLPGLERFFASPRGWAILGGGVLALALLIFGIVALTRPGANPDPVRETATLAAAETPVPQEAEPAETAVGPEEAQPAETAVTLAEAEAQPETASAPAESAAPQGSAGVPDYLAHNPETWRDGAYVPEPMSEYYLPIFAKADRTDKVIAITVDDCFQTANLKQIVEIAEKAGGKLTIFPIGKLLQRPELQEVIRYAHSIGFEIENHTWNHDGLYNFSAEKMARSIFDQDRAVDYVLGVNYYSHFLRPLGGDDRFDLRTHNYLRQMGYYGMAHWSVSGSMPLDYVKEALSPGAVYLFHCTDTNLEKLKEFIPYAVKQGYQLLTLNELFGYEANYEEPLTDDVSQREVLPLAPYERDYRELPITACDYAAYEIQEKLIEKGFLTGNPDGIYGPETASSAAAWQIVNGFKGDGVLTHDQQLLLFDVKQE